jgi:hypothetical protein
MLAKKTIYYKLTLHIIKKGVQKFKALEFWYLIMYVFITYIIIFKIHNQCDLMASCSHTHTKIHDYSW